MVLLLESPCIKLSGLALMTTWLKSLQQQVRVAAVGSIEYTIWQDIDWWFSWYIQHTPYKIVLF